MRRSWPAGFFFCVCSIEGVTLAGSTENLGCFEQLTCVFPSYGISYKTVHHLLGHFRDGRWPKQFKNSIKQDRPTAFWGFC